MEIDEYPSIVQIKKVNCIFFLSLSIWIENCKASFCKQVNMDQN